MKKVYDEIRGNITVLENRIEHLSQKLVDCKQELEVWKGILKYETASDKEQE